MIKIVLVALMLLLGGCFEGDDKKKESSESSELAKSIDASLGSDFTAWQKSGGESGELIPSPIEAEVLNSDTAAIINGASKLRSVPSSFSLRDVGYMSAVKDQGQCGISWAFATYGAIEGSYGATSTLDLSEDHLKHLNGYDSVLGNGSCSGGNIWKSLGYLSNFRGAIDEIMDPYAISANSTYCTTCKATSYIDNAIFIPSRRSVSDVESIKNIIYEKKKPLYATMQVSFTASVYDEATASFYQPSSSASANHAVVIVGWDDSYEAQGQSGAFIVKNSWGTEIGDSGYFYVPYRDATLGFGEMVYFEDDASFSFDTIYSYDNLGTTVALKVSQSTIETANVFTALEDESIVGANFFVLQSGSDVTVEIHKVISQNPLVTQKVSTALFDESDMLRGYYTAQFPLHVSVLKDERFAVVVKYSANVSSASVPVEAKLEYYAGNVSAQSNQSFYRLDDSWVDLTSVRSDLNFPIKALSVIDQNTTASRTLEVGVSATKVIEEEAIDFNVSFAEENASILSVSWDFGDETTGGGVETTHSYTEADDYVVTVSVLDELGNTYESTVSVKVVPQDQGSTIEAAAFSFEENSPSGYMVGTIPFNYSGSVSITLSGSGSEKFVVEDNGTIYTAEDATFDYETTSFYALSATPVDGPGIDDSKDINITIINVDEIQAALQSYSGTIAENSSAGTAVGSITILTQGDSSITSIVLSGTNADDFNVSTEGLIAVSSTESLDYETYPSYSLEAVAYNSAGSSEAVTVSISLTNVPETVPELSAFSTTISENISAGTVIGAVTIVDEGDTAITDMALSGTGHSSFSIATDGEITVVSAIDFETISIFELSAVATNSKGDSDAVDVDIYVNNQAEIAPELADFAVSVVENVAYGTVIGTLEITESGDTEITSITLSGTGNTDFVVSTDGNISVNTTSLDYETRASYDLTAVATNGAGDSDAVSVEITIENAPAIVTAQITADDASADDYFAQSIDLSDTRVLSGAPYEDAGGAAYLYARQSNESYEQLVKIASDDIASGDHFGADVSMDGNLILIGAPYEDENATNAGAAYLFKYISSEQSVAQLAKITPDDNGAGYHFGSAVYISGEKLVIGAPGANSDTGKVYIFKYSQIDENVTITQKSSFVNASVGSGDRFGSEVVMDGDNILVASEEESAYLYSYDSTANTLSVLKTFLTSGNVQAGGVDVYGDQVDIDGNFLVLGSSSRSEAFLYKISSSTAKAFASPDSNDAFGSDVAIDGTYVAIGAEDNDKIHIFDFKELSLDISQLHEAEAEDAQSGFEMGSNVDISGDLFAAGISKDDTKGSAAGILFISDLEAQNRPYLINYVTQLEVEENTLSIFESKASSVNGTSITYTLGGVDANSFAISSDGVIQAGTLDYENPTDVGSDNIYNITLTLTDSANMSYSYPMKIEVLNVSD